MIISYARPFSGNTGAETMLPGLPERFLGGFSSEERDLHEVVMKDRNEVLAHSDSAAWNLRLSVMRSPGHSMLAPLHHDTTAPLKEEPTRMFNGMAIKLMEAAFAERLVLEKELIDVLPTLEDGHVRGDERAMRYGGWSDEDRQRACAAHRHRGGVGLSAPAGRRGRPPETPGDLE